MKREAKKISFSRKPGARSRVEERDPSITKEEAVYQKTRGKLKKLIKDKRAAAENQSDRCQDVGRMQKIMNTNQYEIQVWNNFAVFLISTGEGTGNNGNILLRAIGFITL